MNNKGVIFIYSPYQIDKSIKNVNRKIEHILKEDKGKINLFNQTKKEKSLIRISSLKYDVLLLYISYDSSPCASNQSYWTS